MRIVVNKTHRPLKVHLPQGRVLHLGPHKEGQVTPQALDSAGVKRLVDSGELEVLPDDAQVGSPTSSSGGVAPNTHGHHPHTTVRKRGDR